jgi:hypothetical protein
MGMGCQLGNGEAAVVPDPEAVARFLEKILEVAETAPKRASVSLSRASSCRSRSSPCRIAAGRGATRRVGP